jgi:CHAD domain-containing protein
MRRLGRERVDAALRSLKRWRHPEALHEARKDLKKARALLRLFRDSIPSKDYRKQIRLLREAAALLAATRDAYVRARTLRNNKGRFQGRQEAAFARKLEAQLTSEFRAAKSDFEKHKTDRKVRRLLRRLYREMANQKVDQKGWPAMERGVKNFYVRSRAAWRAAEDRPTPENLHAWRKPSKDLWYVLRILRLSSPQRLGVAADELEALTECLGADRDLTLLREAARRRFKATKACLEFDRQLRLIQRGMRKSAFEIGPQLYRETPTAYCGRLHGYWTNWRKV